MVAFPEGPLGNHHEGISPLSLTFDGPFPVASPMTSMLPQTGHRVRFPACWSSALNFLPHEHNTEIIATTSKRNRLTLTSGLQDGRRRGLYLLHTGPFNEDDYNRDKGHS